MDKYCQAVAVKSNQSILVIIAVVGLLVQIISACWPKPKANDILSGGGVLGNRAINRALRENGIKPASAEGKRLKEIMVDEAAQADPKELTAFFSKCGVEAS